MKNYFISKLFLSSYILISIGVSAQFNPRQFDSIMANAPRIMTKNNVPIQEIIMWENSMLEKAKKHNYAKGVILAKVNLASQYYNIGKPHISLKYLNEAKISANEISADDDTYAKIYLEFSITYFTLGLSDLSLKSNSLALFYIKKMGESDEKNKKLSLLYNIRAITLDRTKSDSAIHYLHKSVNINKTFRGYGDLSLYYIDIRPNVDSAKFYLNKAQAFYNKFKKMDRYNTSVLYYYYGCLNRQQNKYDEAIKYFEKSLAYANGGKNRQHLLGLYDLLAKCYRKTGDISKEKKILDEYKKFNEFYEDAQSKSIQLTIENLEKDLIDKENQKSRRILLYSCIITLLAIIIFIVIYRINRNRIKSEINDLKQKHLHEVVSNKEDIVANFDNLYQSAQSRDPNFYIKFQNFYPNFYKNILELNSEIQKNELHILSYIYLNFETKQIAEILYLSPKTIQNKKYNIRKKLNIPGSDDMYIWLKTKFNS